MSDSGNFDSWRIYHLYRYLFGRLAMTRKKGGLPNITGIAKRVGRDNLRRTITSLFSQEAGWKGSVDQSSTITTGSIVAMLSELRKSLNKEYKKGEIPYSQVLTTEDTLVALHKLIALTPEECEQLDLPKGDGLTLLSQMLLRLRAADGVENYEVIFRSYKEAVGLDFSNTHTVIDNMDAVNRFIADTVARALDYLPDKQSRRANGVLDSPGKQDVIKSLTQKAQREVCCLLIRSGNTRDFLPDNKTEHPYIRHYLRPAFIQKLTQTVVDNERLAQQFPIYLKRVTMEACGPLPFANVGVDAAEAGDAYALLLNPSFQRLDERAASAISGLKSPATSGARGNKPSNLSTSYRDYELASQESVKLTVEFYIRVPGTYRGTVKETFERIASNTTRPNAALRRVDFALTSTGIGGTLAHMIKVINLMLLGDIPCLNSFFPIAHDVTSTQQIIRDNVSSPVWSHSLVQLCYNQAVAQSLLSFGQSDTPYETISFGDPIGHGDFCGFDFLLSQAQAALQARLQAIRNTGVNPSRYLSELCERTEKLLVLEQAWSSLKRYPFSSMAMIGTLHKAIIGGIFNTRALNNKDPYICFDAYLSITEALLDEGAYRASFPYLKGLEHLNRYVQQGLETMPVQVLILLENVLENLTRQRLHGFFLF